MTTQTDYIRECMQDPALAQRAVPIDQFCQAYCIVCGQKECIRSRANTMLFTDRVDNWESRLFLNVPRAADNDENYARIRSKRFLPVQESVSVNSAPDHTFVPPVVPPVVQKEEPVGPQVHSPPIESTKSTTPESIPTPQRVVGAEPTLNNTPFQGGIVLPGKPSDSNKDESMGTDNTFTFGEDE